MAASALAPVAVVASEALIQACAGAPQARTAVPLASRAKERQRRRRTRLGDPSVAQKRRDAATRPAARAVDGVGQHQGSDAAAERACSGAPPPPSPAKSVTTQRTGRESNTFVAPPAGTSNSQGGCAWVPGRVSNCDCDGERSRCVSSVRRVPARPGLRGGRRRPAPRGVMPRSLCASVATSGTYAARRSEPNRKGGGLAGRQGEGGSSKRSAATASDSNPRR